MSASSRATADGGTPEEKKAVRPPSNPRRTAAGKNTEQDVLDAIAAMDDTDRALAEGATPIGEASRPERRHVPGTASPPRAMHGKILFFQFASKFKTRYGHIGFQDAAQLDDGTMWPTAYALTRWTTTNEQAVAKTHSPHIGK